MARGPKAAGTPAPTTGASGTSDASDPMAASASATAVMDPEAPLPVSGITMELAIADITPSPFNPRTHFDREELESLGASLVRHGQLQNVLVRPSADGRYELAAGERRWRAAKLVGLRTLRAEVRHLDDAAFVEIVNIENLQRSDLHPLEEARGFRSLMELAGYKVPQLATRFKRGETYVYDALKLLQLTPFAQECFLAGRFSKDHAILLSRLAPRVQDQLVGVSAKALEHGDLPPLWTSDEGLFSKFAEDDEAPLADVAPITVKKLKNWIDEHVRFSIDADVAPALFPVTVTAVAEAEVANVKVVEITEEHYVQPDARSEKKILGPRSWERADGERGSKACEHAVLGLVVAGPGRGTAFRVCIAKTKCTVHWKEQVQAAKAREREKSALAGGGAAGVSGADARAKAQEKERARQSKAQAEQRFNADVEEATYGLTLDAMAAKFGTLKIVGDAPVVEKFLEAFDDCFRCGERAQQALGAAVPKRKTAEDLARYLVARVAFSRGWWGQQVQRSALAALKIDPKGIAKQARADVEARAQLACQYCGCSEAKACELPNGNPCTWHSTTPPVCSAAACVKALKKGAPPTHAAPAKAAPAPKAKGKVKAKAKAKARR